MTILRTVAVSCCAILFALAVGCKSSSETTNMTPATDAAAAEKAEVAAKGEANAEAATAKAETTARKEAMMEKETMAKKSMAAGETLNTAAVATPVALIKSFKTNANAFEDALAGVTPDQWNYREEEGRWSIGEVAEHIILSEGLLLGMLKEGAMMSDARPAKAEGRDETDAKIAMFMSDRSQKFQAPEPGQPAGVYSSPADAIADFKEARAATHAFLSSTTVEDLRTHYGEHPAFGEIDGYQWMIFLVEHANRHLAQIQQVKDHAGYPM